MTPEQIKQLGPAFADYLDQFLFCCDYTQTFHLLGVYCRGLLFRCFGRRPRPGQKASRADDLVRHSPRFTRQPGQVVRLPRQALGEQKWEAKAARVWLPGGGERTYWLLWARHARTGEEKYFVSSAAASEPLGHLVRAGFCRWNVEVTFEGVKQVLGLEDPANRLPQAVRRTAPMALVLYSLIVLWFDGGGQAWVQFPQRPWYRRKREPSFQDMVTTLRRQSWEEKFAEVVSPSGPHGKWLARVAEWAARVD
jgi:hypothetical protein